MTDIAGPVLHIARFVLECRTPLSVATGSEGPGSDTELVRDANGVPALPGSALAGVLRHLYCRAYGEDAERALFGYQEHDKGYASRLQVAWGALLDSRGKPVEGLLLGDAARRLETDLLLRAARASRMVPDLRDRVRLDHRGRAADQAKFDRTVLPAGHRFACEITLRSERPESAEWQQVLGLLSHPMLRLGGAVRSGLGALALVSLHTADWDLRTPADAAAYRRLGISLADYTGLQAQRPGAAPAHGVRAGWLRLRPRHFWRIGQGNVPLSGNHDEPPDLLPKREDRWVWGEGQANRQAGQVLIPGSAIKGALAHRVAFHAHRLAQRFAEHDSAWQDGAPAAPPEVAELFGEIRDDDQGHAGRVIIEDALLSPAEFKGSVQVHTHNVIDRFAGGVRNHLLFSEQMLWQGEIALRLVTDRLDELSDQAQQAWELALNDLCQGRLAIGGGTGRGHGFCEGALVWEDASNDEEAGA